MQAEYVLIRCILDLMAIPYRGVTHIASAPYGGNFLAILAVAGIDNFPFQNEHEAIRGAMSMNRAPLTWSPANHQDFHIAGFENQMSGVMAVLELFECLQVDHGSKAPC